MFCDVFLAIIFTNRCVFFSEMITDTQGKVIFLAIIEIVGDLHQRRTCEQSQPAKEKPRFSVHTDIAEGPRSSSAKYRLLISCHTEVPNKHHHQQRPVVIVEDPRRNDAPKRQKAADDAKKDRAHSEFVQTTKCL